MAKCFANLMIRSAFGIAVFILALTPCPSSANSDFDYCWVRSSSDDAENYHSLRNLIENNYNREDSPFCRSAIFFEKNKSFNISLKKSLKIQNPKAKDYDNSGSVFTITGHQSSSVLLDGSNLGTDSCVLMLDVNTSEGPVLITDLNIKVNKIKNAICTSGDNVEFITHNVSIQAEDDSDEDGVGTEDDNCPTLRNPSQIDTDGDQVGDDCDNCPLNDNTDQKDGDEDNLGDECEAPPPRVPSDDQDNDGLDDGDDNCPMVANPDQTDTDQDGVGDECDNCPLISNQDQKDDDNDGTGDECPLEPEPPDPGEEPGDPEPDPEPEPDPPGDDDGGAPVDIPPPENPDDQDGDGALNDADNCPSIANAGQENGDGDSLGDACDPTPTVAEQDEDSEFVDMDSDAASGCALNKHSIDKNQNVLLRGITIFAVGFILIFKKLRNQR